MSRRTFILGAGFSKPAGMPLATTLLPLLRQKFEHDDMNEWLVDLSKRLAWLTHDSSKPFTLNIEELFHYAHFDVEIHRLRQHLSSVGRLDGPDTAWADAESVEGWLANLLDALRDVIFECDDKSDLAPISRWAKSVGDQDSVISFNYDTLAERALDAEGKQWNHGTPLPKPTGTPVFKLHGSIDWIVAARPESLRDCDLLFDKPNTNRTNEATGHVEEDFRLWRCRTRDQLRNWIEGRDLQLIPRGGTPLTIGIAGLGAYKEVHQIPGLGLVWTHAMRGLYSADSAIFVGFSMSDFDTMAKLQFAEVARARFAEGRPLPVTIIDPFADDATADRFRRVFRYVNVIKQKHEEFDWSSIAGT